MRAFSQVVTALFAFVALSIPLGCKQSEAVVGDAGPQGPVGPQGPQGLAGQQGAPGVAPVVYYGEQDGGVAVSTMGLGQATAGCGTCWIALAEVDFKSGSSGTYLDLSAVGAVATTATSGTTICGFRFFVPSPADAPYGDLAVYVPAAITVDSQFVPVSLSKRVPLALASTYNVLVQMDQISADPNNCYVDGRPNTRFRVYATLRP